VHIATVPCVNLYFEGTPGTSYQIQTATNLSNPSWQNLTVIPANASGFYTYTNFPSGSQVFYRTSPIAPPTNGEAILSLDPANPLTESVGVYNAAQGTYLGLPVLVFDVSAQGADLHLHTVVVDITTNGQGAVTAAYLYQGSIPVASAAVSGGQAVFSNIPDGQTGAGIPVNSTVPYTVKVDVAGLASPGAIETVSASAAGLAVYNALDGSVDVNGLPAVGNAITVFGPGPVFSLSGAPTIMKQTSEQDQNGNSTSTYTATFDVNVTAIGSSITLGLPGSSSPAFS
jgi:hypothetical protein